MLGGGHREILDLTVATYDSAYLMIEHIGHRFGMLVFDECHHLPSPQYQMIAQAAIAPFRLGLSATVERSMVRKKSSTSWLGIWSTKEPLEKWYLKSSLPMML